MFSKMLGFENLWIIGNGFDLSCDLKTGYYNFLTCYASSESVARLKKDEYKSDRFIPKTEHYLARMYDEPMQIMGDTFFSLDYYVNHFDASPIEHFKSLIHQGLNDWELSGWSDLELKMGMLTREINTPDTYGLCIDDLHLALNQYMKKINEEPVDYKKFKVLCDIFENVDPNNTVFIVLNYTRHFEQFIRSIKDTKNFAIVYLHGTAEVGNTVFGVGDEMQIFNPEFAKNLNISQRLIKDNIAYDYFDSFLENNLLFVRDVVNIFGCSMGESDVSLWYSFMEPYNQSGHGMVHVYDAYKKTFTVKENKKCDYYDPIKAKENEIVCSMLPHFYSKYDDDIAEMIKGKFNEIVSTSEEYITVLEQQNNTRGSRMVKYHQIKGNGDFERYFDVMEKYLCYLEKKYGRIDTYADTLDGVYARSYNLLDKAKEFIDKNKKTYMQSDLYQQRKKLNKIVSNAEVLEFRRVLKNFMNTGELSTPFLGWQPGVYPITEEPLKTLLNEYSRLNDIGIKEAIAKNRGQFYTNIDGAKLYGHKYTYLRLSKHANEKCMCDIDLAIGKIVNLDKKNGFVFVDDDTDLDEVNWIIQESTKFYVNKVKKILQYHPTYCIEK